MKILSDQIYIQRAKKLQEDYSKYDVPNLAVDMIEELIENEKKN